MRTPHTIDFGKYKDRPLEDIPTRYLETVPNWEAPKGYDSDDWARLQLEVRQELELRKGDQGNYPVAVQGLTVICACGEQLRTRGAVYYGIPDSEGRMTQTNICRACAIVVQAFIRGLKIK